jgi:hypothetical protein
LSLVYHASVRALKERQTETDRETEKERVRYRDRQTEKERE